MTIYYFLTIDQATTKKSPTKKTYYNTLVKLRKIANFSNTNIKCYEHKHKSKKFPKWLHYHCIIRTERIISFRSFQVKGFSVKIKLLRSTEDIIRTTVYIMKHKVDACDLCKNRVKPDVADIMQAIIFKLPASEVDSRSGSQESERPKVEGDSLFF